MNSQNRFSVFSCAVGIGLLAVSVSARADLGDQLFKLLPDDGAFQDFFGVSVAINGNTAIVGAWGDDDNGPNSGSAYLFDTTTGQQLFKLLPDDGEAFDFFGLPSSISGTTAIVGAAWDDDNGDRSGSAYLFDTTTGQQLFKLLANDGPTEDFFGISVAISPDGIGAIVGAYGDDDNGAFSGSAYLFDTTTGRQLFKFLANDGAEGDFFGWSVAISGDTAIVGAHHDDDNGSWSGSAYLFDITTGRQLFKLLPNDGAANDFFGISVAISGTTAIVGAQGAGGGAGSGSAYLFDTTTGLQIAKLLPDDGAGGNLFGASVAISSTIAIVGAPQDGDNGTRSGSAYLFDAGSGSGTPATLTDLTMIDGFIVSGGLPELASSDDMYFSTLAFETGKASETHRLLYQVRALTTVQNPTTLAITLEGHILDIEANVTLFLKNFDTGLFEEVGQFTNVFGVDTTNTVNVPDAARFVRPNGRIVLRVKKVIILPITIGEGFPSLDDLLEIRVR